MATTPKTKTCPICLKEIENYIREGCYMDGWHHYQCLDDYMNGRVELPTST